MKDFHAFRLDPQSARREPSLREFLIATRAFERLRRVRIGLICLLISISLALWICAAWPSLLPSLVGEIVWISWLASFAGMLIAWAMEWSWHKKRLLCLGRLGRPPAWSDLTE